MTSPSEQWIVSSLRQATERMPLPPESRWIPEPRSTGRLSTSVMLGAVAIFAVAIGLTIIGRHVVPAGSPAAGPTTVPAAGRSAGPSAFAELEEAAWGNARSAMPSDLAVLRPAWLPYGFRGAPWCPSPFQGRGSSYAVTYASPDSPAWNCAAFGMVSLAGQLGAQDDTALLDGFIETGTFSARGTTVHVRSRVPGTNAEVPFPWLNLWWNESGAHYDVMSNGVELDDLVRVIRSLAPVPMER